MRSIVATLGPRPAPPWERIAAEDPAVDPAQLYGAVPVDPRKGYNPREIVARLVDGSRWHEFKALYAKTLVCGFAHIDGHPGRDPRQPGRAVRRERPQGRPLRRAL